VTEKCKICGDIFSKQVELLNHFEKIHLSQLESIPCMFCDNNFPNFEDILHHIILEHKGMEKSLLEFATAARETKKRLGNYLDANKKDIGTECPTCYEIFPNIEKLSKHALKEHDRVIKPDFVAKMKKMVKNIEKNPPLCEMCNRRFIGVIFTKINNKVMNVCFNCYEDYFGANMLARVTMGTNEDMIKKMREPIE